MQHNTEEKKNPQPKNPFRLVMANQPYFALPFPHAPRINNSFWKT